MSLTTVNTELKPQYRQLIDEFRSQIERGAIEPGARLPSFTEMRVQRGASQATVDRVYNVLETDGLIVREKGRGTFVAYKAGRVRTGFIGFLGFEFSFRDQYRHSAEIAEGIEEVLHREGWRVALLTQNSTLGWDKIDGMIITGGDRDFINRNLPPGLPRVALWSPGYGNLSVVVDNFGGGRQAAEHLIELGHRRIAAIVQMKDLAVRSRFHGLQDAMKEAGIDVAPQWLNNSQVRMTPQGYRAWGYEVMKDWLAADWFELGCTAIFVQNDVAALGVIEALQDGGVSVPGDISIISFDGTDVCDYYKPRITSIQVPLRKMGVYAAESLVQQINGADAKDATLMLPTRLKLGESAVRLVQ